MKMKPNSGERDLRKSELLGKTIDAQLAIPKSDLAKVISNIKA